MIRVAFPEYTEIGDKRLAGPFAFYWLEETELHGFRYISATPDTSRLGTRLARWFRMLGYRPSTSCKCRWTELMLDQAGIEFIEHEQEAIVKLIVTNAQELGKTVSLSVVRTILAAAIRLEKRRAKR